MLGKTMRDEVSGFTGIATGKLEWMNGCVQFFLKPKIGDDQKMRDGEWIDSNQLTVVGDGITMEKRDTGGPAAEGIPTRFHG